MMMIMSATTTCRRPLAAKTARWVLAGSRHYHTATVSRGAFSALDTRIIPSSSRHNRHESSPLLVPDIQVRFFAAAPNPDKKEESEEEGGSFITRTFKQVLTPQNQFYALVAGGTIGAYGISRIFLSFTTFFTHLTPTTIAKWGFYTGFGCASVVGGLALVTFDNMYIRADPVYRYCLRWVQSDTHIQRQLGDGLQPGSLRSYRLDSGKLEIVGRSPVWRAPRIQMIFDVAATGPPYRTGIVTCEAIKMFGIPPRLKNVAQIDYEVGNEGEEGGTREDDQTYFLKGSQEEFSRVSKRSGLSLDMLARSVHIEKAAAGRQ
ncbi:expressed unknown protein [Seminavis robusta]|uniref:Uncharacterized protein n=1 Tax=Seminavis robusta TaxID=568900 RepID=A0A9N8EDN6_9STRA|nr:expressed unknown protein [Seminavis robusta]|eukprot:Sro1024_g232620.1 n/a (319) ;mRNA; f:13550-14767